MASEPRYPPSEFVFQLQGSASTVTHNDRGASKLQGSKQTKGSARLASALSGASPFVGQQPFLNRNRLCCTTVRSDTDKRRSGWILVTSALFQLACTGTTSTEPVEFPPAREPTGTNASLPVAKTTQPESSHPAEPAAPLGKEDAPEELSPDEPNNDWLLQKLSAVARHPIRFKEEWTPKGFVQARELFTRVNYELKAGKWKEEQRVQCGEGTDGRALVTVGSGRVRALTVMGGSEDSYSTRRYFFDDKETLQFVFITYGHVSGTQAEYLMIVDDQSTVVACNTLILKKGYHYDQCKQFNAVDAKAEFGECRAGTSSSRSH